MSASKKVKDSKPTKRSGQPDEDFPYLLPEEKIKYGYVLCRLAELEKGDAILLKQMVKGKIVYDPKAKLFYHFDKHHWIPDTPSSHRLRKIISEKLPAQYKYTASELAQRSKNDLNRTKLIDLLNQRASTLRTRRGVQSVVFFAETELMKEDIEWDSKPDLLGVKNGVVELQTGTLRDGRPEDYITEAKTVPHSFLGLDVDSTTIEKFMKDVFHPDVVDFMQRVLGSGITGYSRDHSLIILHGPKGRNGKDTTLNHLQYVLGELVGPASADVFMERRGRSPGSAEPHIVALVGKRLIWIDETAQGEAMNERLVKLMTGGGRQSSRGLWGHQLSFTPSYTPLLLTNHLPMAIGDDQAFWERINVVGLENRFVDNPDPNNPKEKPRDIHLLDKLNQDAAGTLAWLVRGAMDWYRQGGLNPPEIVRIATQAYRETQDIFAQFKEDCLEEIGNHAIRASKLQKEFAKYIKPLGIKINKDVFAEKMRQWYPQKRKGDGLYYVGVDVRSDDD